MIEFSYPWLLLLLPLPIAIYKFAPAYKVKQQAVHVPFFDVLVRLLNEAPTTGGVKLEPQVWQKIALILVWCLLVIAMAKPVWLGEPQVRDKIGRDLMMVVDLSGSMDAKDFSMPGESSETITRLDAVKNVMADFVANRRGDRLGLILFGDAAYLQAPFTEDHQAWIELLNETRVAMAGQSTHLGDALGLAIKVIDEAQDISREAGRTDIQGETADKVVILLTDGNDTDSLVPPLEAAKIAAHRGIRVHVIAIGDPRTIGEQALDMVTIEGIATITGGRAFQAVSKVELENVYREIEALEPAQYASLTYQPKVSMHYLPVAIAICLFLLASTLVLFKRMIMLALERNRLGANVKNLSASNINPVGTGSSDAELTAALPKEDR
ncbi:VWA domain-containing protein [Shewanella benthica]|uniref:VWA domain-containing protein n=1 Tax=Shewanella benthica TaxID=43661 RepID=UPI00187A2391|nr:VWA domain-containing protein [Shewanella benthica]MBE7215939.1 VWA domain-containing protein [Shewanella benthica]MCL1063631.1 VWA domain-containing protein [Shewanella benthica]